MTAPIKHLEKKKKKGKPPKLKLRKLLAQRAREEMFSKRGSTDFARMAIAMNLRFALNANGGKGNIDQIEIAASLAKKFSIDCQPTINQIHIRLLMKQGKYLAAAEFAKEKGETRMMREAARLELSKNALEYYSLTQKLAFANYFGLEGEILSFGTSALETFSAADRDGALNLLGQIIPCSLHTLIPDKCKAFLRRVLELEPLKVAEVAKEAGFEEIMGEAAIAHILHLLEDPSAYFGLRQQGIPHESISTLTVEGAAKAFGISEERVKELREDAGPPEELYD